MRYRVLGRTGLRVSAIACGSNSLKAYSQEQANIAYNHAIDKGVNLILTSAAYGSVESMISEAVSHRRDDFYIATTTDHRSAEGAWRDIENSLRVFKTGYIDVYQVGGIRDQEGVDKVFASGGAMEALTKARREGKVGYIGVTGHHFKALNNALKTGCFDTVLFFFNMARIHALDELFPIAKELNVGTLAMQPLSHGWLKPVDKALRFVLSSPVNVIVSGMYTPSMIDENTTVTEPEPTEEEWRSLLREASAIDTGCRGGGCHSCLPCPRGNIDIPAIMNLINYKAKYGLQPIGDAGWQSIVENAGKCNECGLCERRCPYGLSIIPEIRRSI